MSKLIQDVAFSLGCEAYKKGKDRIPALDKDLLDNCIAGCKVGEGLPYLKAWLKGWNFENLRKEI